MYLSVSLTTQLIILFKTNFIDEINSGQKLIICGDIKIYSVKGQYQFIAKNIYKSGEGKIWLEFNRLKKQLDQLKTHTDNATDQIEA